MADQDDKNDDGKFVVDEETGRKLLDDIDDNDDDGDNGESEKDTTDWKAEAEKWKKLSRTNEKSFKTTADKLKQYEDSNKSELEKLTEDRDRTRADAAKATAQAQAMTAAIDRAPEWATPAIIKKVARRARGEGEELAEDIDDLYDMAAPKGNAAPKTPGKPKERLKGGSEPDDEAEETDGRKIAARIPRSALI